MQKNIVSRITIVIPVYNEAEHLRACLSAIAKQRHQADEVIVVDNNSVDASRAIANSFPFVTVINEAKQGVIHARARGFDAAKSDIIARIDADTRLPADWTLNLLAIFANEQVDAVSGAVGYYDLPFEQLNARVDLFFRRRIARAMGDEVFLYGANMAIRRRAWLKSRHRLCQDGGFHEDFDLAIHAEESGAKVVFDKSLKAGVSLRRIDVGWRDFWEYVILNPRSYARHGRHSQKYMYPALIAVVGAYWLLKILHRGYDSQTLKFSWQKLLTPVEDLRVNPATFVD